MTPSPHPPRALIVVPAGRTAPDRAAACAAYCRRRGYRMSGVVVGTDPARWAAVLQMIGSRQAEVVVVPSRQVIPGEVETESVTQELPERPPERAGRPEPHITPHRTRRRPRFLR